MNRRNILSSSAITALGLILLPGSTVAQQKSIKEQLVGMAAGIVGGLHRANVGLGPYEDFIQMLGTGYVDGLRRGN